MQTDAAWVFLKDEVVGFAKSRAMLIMWIVIPLVALAGYLLIGGSLNMGSGGEKVELSATQFMGLLVGGFAGTVAALIVAVDLVAERNRNVYVLFAVRPFRREIIIYTKFVAVFGCVAGACIMAMLIGLTADAVRGRAITAAVMSDVGTSLLKLSLTIAISAAGGVMAGVMARSIVVAVLLVLYLWQNFAMIPNIPLYFRVSNHWLYTAIPAVLIAVFVLWGANLFKKAQL
ncbi:MAG: hypothetical protein KF773_14370 [Deltaproteobacteria bacterium]|nr:hypothetical protein [Deltaproteobacteria bacterium]MCW5807339.1 hypothetical protein [Deltaproteobacteria bacterium]